MNLTLTVNGEKRTVDVEDRTLLVHLLRDSLGLTATNIGCDTTSCGACTVLAASVADRSVTTLEGLADGDQWHAVQQAFRDKHGLQCGFCTPGMVMAAVSLLSDNPSPTREQVRNGLEGNLCRCTGYHNIVSAVMDAAGGAK
ncbi:MAG TPA: (2Fe-2S)-binding protein [Mycobacteriales bacterium]|nr:(2Fe-2S)-binding protein [Mycobacteriales bacterium]